MPTRRSMFIGAAGLALGAALAGCQSGSPREAAGAAQSAFEIKAARANGVDLAYVEAGTGPLVLLLHGFPDNALTWEEVLGPLADAGFRAVAPFTRGYHPSAIPSDGDYSLEALASDALAMIGALGEERAVIVGHDWGASTAFVAANIDPLRVRALVTLAIPHPRVTRLSPLVAQRFPHFLIFQFGPLSEGYAEFGDFAYLRYLYRYWSPSWVVPDIQIERMRSDFSRPGRLAAALGYYRGYAQDARDPRRAQLYRAKTSVPTLSFVGVEDKAWIIGMFDGMEDAFEGPFELVEVERAGHFLHRERPDLFAERLLGFLGAL